MTQRETSPLRSNLRIKIAPVRVLLLNELDLPVPPPLLEALLPQNCRLNIFVDFYVNQPMDVVPAGLSETSSSRCMYTRPIKSPVTQI
jgi:hypothetical protein